MPHARANWPWIKKRFRMGFAFRQIAEDYRKHFPGRSISHQVIARKSKAQGWQRDLSQDYEEAVERKLIHKTTGDKGDNGDDFAEIMRSDAEAVEDAAELAAEVVTTHRKDAVSLRTKAMAIIDEVGENAAMTAITRNGDEVTVHVDVTKRASALNQASRALSTAVDIERRSLNLDRKEGQLFGGGQFVIVTNVPEPDPLPPGI